MLEGNKRKKVLVILLPLLVLAVFIYPFYEIITSDSGNAITGHAAAPLEAGSTEPDDSSSLPIAPGGTTEPDPDASGSGSTAHPLEQYNYIAPDYGIKIFGEIEMETQAGGGGVPEEPLQLQEDTNLIFNLSEANFTLNGVGADDRAGTSVASGDVDGDGNDDVIIGAYRSDPGTDDEGTVYVFRGGQTDGEYNLSSDAYYTLNGIDANDYSGYGIASGDIDGDGTDDVIIGAYQADPNGNDRAGEVYVFKGGQSSGEYNMSTDAYYTLNGIDIDDFAGKRVYSGDVDGDGTDDVIISADSADPNAVDKAGEVYVFKGGQSTGEYNMSTDAYYILNGIDADDRAGTSVSSGDVDGDGKDDVIIGAYTADPNGVDSAGEVYVFKGGQTSGEYNLSTDAYYTLNGINASDYSGISLSSGDVDGDGNADVIFGAYFGDPNGENSAGEVYVFKGGQTTGEYNMSTDAYYTLNGIDASDYAGTSVSSGDIDNDGNDDVIIGANRADPNGVDSAGEIYVFRGGQTNGTYNLSDDAYYTLNGVGDTDYAGDSVSSGDVDADGADDVIIGAGWADPNGNNESGEVYVVYGFDPVAPSISFIDPTPHDGASVTANVTINLTSSDASNNLSAVLDWNSTIFGWWRFEESSGSTTFVNYLGDGENGSCSGNGCPNVTTGMRGEGLHFDGADDKVDFGSVGDMSQNGSFSFSVWYKRDVKDTVNADGIMGDWRWYSDSQLKNGWLLRYYINTDDVGFIMEYLNSTGGTKESGLYYSAPNIGSWYHAAGTVDVSTGDFKLYIDGELADSKVLSDMVSVKGATDYPFRIGYSPVNTGYFNGSIDEPILFQRAISAEEVKALYDAGSNKLSSSFTDLAVDDYTFKAYAIDQGGNINSTSEYTVTVDTTSPSVSFVSPTPDNASVISDDWAYVNVSASDNNDNISVVLDWNRSLREWLRLENGNGTFFEGSSSYAGNATCSGSGCPFASVGMRGGAYTFDGVNDYITVTDDSHLDNLAQKSVFVWVKFNANSNQGYPYYDGYWTAPAYGDMIRKDSTGDTVTIGLRNVVGSSEFFTFDYTPDEWTHVGYTYDGTDVLYYKNGAQVGSDIGITGALKCNSTSMRLGTIPGDYFNGSVDELMIFDRALSPEEINATYQAGLYSLSANITGLTDGEYDYTAHVVDAAGNLASTEERTLTVDSVYPSISFVSPTPDNASVISDDWAYVNVSASDSSDLSVVLDWDRSIVGWWMLDEGNGTYFVDSSSWSKNGTCAGDGCPTLASGARGDSYAFDGVNDYVDIAADSAFDGIPELTVAAWVNLAELGRTHDIVAFSGPNANRNWEFYVASGGSLLLKISNGTQNEALNQGSVTPGEWTFIAGRYKEGENLSVTINNQTWSTTPTIDLAYTSRTMYIGSLQAGDYSVTNGSIDNVMIWNRTLSTDELNALYDANTYAYSENLTSLADGDYTYTAHALDAAGNLASTEERSLTVDGSAPSIAFVSPTYDNGTATPNDWAYVNVSASDSSDFSTILDWNRSIVGWWRLEEGNGTYFVDSSTWGNNVSCSGSACPDLAAGKRGDAYAFDGVEDYIPLGNNAQLKIPNNFTWMAWVYPLHEGADRNSILCNYKGSGKETKLEYNGQGNRFIFYAENSTTNALVYSPENGAPAGSWYHVAGTYDLSDVGQEVKLYVNGELAGTNSLTGDVSYGNNFYIGIRLAGQEFFNGTIDEAMIIERALSAEEINASYQAGTYRLEENFTSLADGDYTYTAYAVDIAGNLNSTEERTLTVDSSAPSIAFVSPTYADGAATTHDWAYVNVSASDNNDFSVFLDWNRSLQGWWRLEEDSGTTFVDSSSYSNNATCSNCPTYATGYRGDAWTFDGVGNVLDAGDPVTNVTDNWTISFWAKPLDNTSGQTQFAMVNGQTGSAGYAVRMASSGEWGVLYGGVVGTTITSSIVGEWQHVVATRNDGTLYFYLNGVKYTSTTSTPNPPTDHASAKTLIGAEFNGTLDEVQIFDRAFTDEEVNASYAAGTYRLEENLTSLADGDYTYTAYAFDGAGHISSTGENTLTVDTDLPSIDFVSPTPDNASVISDDWTLVNVSASDSSDLSVVLDWNRSLAGWWRLEEGNGTSFEDTSSWGNNATCVGGACPDLASGIRGDAYSFNGVDEYINLGSPLSSPDAWTYAVWFYANTNSTAYDGLIGQTYDPRMTWGDANSRKVRTHMIWTESPGYLTLASSHLTLNDWYFAVYTVDTIEKELKLYIDGVLVDNKTWSVGTVTKPDTTHYLNYRGANNYFNGSMDEAMIFSRALSLDEVESLYDANANSYGKNMTSLADGDYTYTAHVVDVAGRLNSTEERMLTVDNSVPSVAFVSPTPDNGTVTSNDWAYVNVSASDSSDMSVLLDWNRSIIGWWRLEEGAGSTTFDDYSSWNNDGSCSGGTCPTRISGSRGGAYSFDGTQYIDCDNSSELDLTDNFTISVFIRNDDTGNYTGVFAKNHQTENTGYAIVKFDTDNIVFRTAGGSSSERILSDSSIGIGEWKHVVVVMDSGTASMYIDGVKQSDSKSLTIPASGEKLLIGAYYANNPGNYKWKGDIDEVVIFDRVLSEEEINASYQAGLYALSTNVSGLESGDYTYTAYAVDAAGNLNSTEERTVTIQAAAALEYILPLNGTEIIRGNDAVNEDPESYVSDFTTLQARVFDAEDGVSGVSANCTFYLAGSLVGYNTTNAGGYCNYTFDHTGYSAGDKELIANFTLLDSAYEKNATGFDANETLTIVVYETVLEKTNQRGSGAGHYLKGDAAILDINITKDGTLVDVNSMTVEARKSSPDILIETHTYPGDIVRTDVGKYYSKTIVNESFGSGDIHWKVYVDDNKTVSGVAQATVISATSGSHADVDIQAATATLNLSMIGADGNVLNNTAITLYDRNLYELEDTVLLNTAVSVVRDGAQNDTYDARYVTDDGVTFRLRDFNVTLTDFEMSPQVVENYAGSVPSTTPNMSDVVALNASAFNFGNATITIPLEGLSTIRHVYHCTDWDFASADCTTWEQNDTSDYSDFTINATHFSFTVNSFTAYAGGDGYSSELAIWDQNDSSVPYGDQNAYTDEQIHFFANYTNSTSDAPISGADCAISFNDSSNGDMTYNSTKTLFEYNRTFGTEGSYSWNVTCNMTGYDTLNATDAINLTVSNTAPEITSIVLNSTTGANTSDENLTAYVSATDGEGDNVTVVYNWLLDGSSITQLALPFDTQVNSEADGAVKDYSGDGSNATLIGGEAGVSDSGSNSTQCTEATNYDLNTNNDYYNGWTFEATSGTALGNTVTVSDYIVYDAVNNKSIVFASSLTGFTNGDSYRLYYEDKQGPEWTDSGIVGGAYVFDGIDDFIDANAVPSFVGKTDLTLEAWIKPATVSGYKSIITKNGPFDFLLNDDKLDFRIYNGSWSALTSDLSLSADTWYHVVAKYDGSTMSLYVNGSLDKSASKTGGMLGNGCLQIGRYNNGACYGGAGRYFNGTMDEVRIYNRSLSAEQIYQRYIETKEGSSSNAAIVSSETDSGDVWQACATPNDGTVDGAENCSDTLTVLNTAPEITSIVLNSTTGANLTTENLTAYVSTSDLDDDNVTVVYDWRLDGSSIAVLNMPFEATGGNESSWVKDYSSGSQHGTVFGATWNRTGDQDGFGAYEFDGVDDYIYTGLHRSEFDVTNGKSYSLEVWAKPTDCTTEKRPIFGMPGAGNWADWTLGGISCYDDGSPEIQFTSGYNGTSYGTITAGITIGEWYHIVGVFNTETDTIHLYLDGEEVNNASHNGVGNYLYDRNYTIGTANWLGSVSSYFDLNFTGSIGEVKVYNRSISAEQIKELYQHGYANIVNEETSKDEYWSVCITPNDRTLDGAETCSENLTILNSLPYVENVTLNSTTGANLTTENLTAYVSTSDLDDDNVTVVYNWLLDGSSIAVLNMPFEATGGNESSWVKDYSGINNHGSVTSATWNGTGGYDGWGAYEFDGINDYILTDLTGTEFDTNGGATYSLAAWVYVNKTTCDLSTPIFGRSGSGSWSNWLFGGFYCSTSVIGFTPGYNGSSYNQINAAFTPNTWHHLVGVCDNESGTATFYKDGAEVSAVSGIMCVNHSNSYTSNKYSIGRSVYSNSAYFNYNFTGKVDDIMIFNRSISPEQVKSLYEHGYQNIVEDETSLGDNWSVCVTPNDGVQDGAENCSDTLTVLNTAPEITSIVLNSTTGANTSDENLTAYVSTSDLDDDNVTVVYDWRLDGSSIAVLNMPFEATGGNESSWTKDYSSFGNYGTVTSATWNSTGGQDEFGAYDFDGVDDLITVNNIDVDTSAGAYTTVTFWMNWTGGNDEMPFSFGTAYDFYIHNTNCAGFNSFASDVYGFNPSSIEDKWVHMALVFYNGAYTDNSKIYVDGVEQTLTQCLGTAKTPTITSTAYIGAWQSAMFFNGSIDDLIIFNRSLSTDQIKSLYDNGYQNIIRDETSVGDDWSVCATPNDGTVDGAENCSGNLTIENRVPVIDSIVLNSTSGENKTTENLTVYTSASDDDSDPVTVGYDWRVGGVSDAMLNMPFDINGSNEDSTVVKDYTTYSRNGTVGDGTNSSEFPTWNSSCGAFTGSGGCYEFDNDEDYLMTSYNMNSTAPWTMSFWLNSRETENNQDVMNGRDHCPRIMMHADSMTVAYKNLSHDYKNTGISTSITDGQWYHFVLTWDGFDMILYKDGVNVSSVELADGMFDAPGGFVSMGRIYVGYSVDASIDQVMVWDRVLSADEVSMQYNGGAGRYDRTHPDATSKSDVWTVAATPFDGIEEGITNISNSLTIVESNITVNLTSPSDDWYVNNTVVFECSGYNTGLSNVTLYHNYSGTWGPNESVSVSGASATVNFTVYGFDTEKDFVWNCEFCDTEDCYFADANRTLHVDTTNPGVSFISPTPADNEKISSERPWAFINVSASDASGNFSSLLDWNSSLVGWWGLEEGSGSTTFDDQSSWSKDGSCSGGNCPVQTMGARGKASSFDGVTDFISSPSSSFNINTTGTIMLWVKPNGGFDTNDVKQGVLLKNSAGGNPGDVSCGFHNLTGVFSCGGGTANSGNFASATSSLAVATQRTSWDDEWYHITLAWNSSNKSLYVNGQYEDSTSQSDAWFSNTDTLYLARGITSGQTVYFNGSIDEVSLLNRRLSIEEIKSSYQAGIYELSNNFTGLIEGESYDYTAYAIDQAGNVNSTMRTLSINNEPVISSVVLNSTDGLNRTTENLTAYVTSSDGDGDSLTHIYDWRLGGVSDAVLNMPFDVNGSDESSIVVKDYTTHSNNGTVGDGADTAGFPVWNSSCGAFNDSGACYNFDGVDDYIEIGADSSFSGVPELTVAGWVNIAQLGSTNKIVAFSGPTNNRNWEFYIASGGALGIRITNSTANQAYTQSGVTPGEWTFVAARYKEGETLSVTIDDQTWSTTPTLDLAYSSKPMYIGSLQAGNFEPFNGSIDNVMIWNRTLSADELNMIYNGGAGRYNRTHPNATSQGDVWTVDVTPVDDVEEGTAVLSNNLTIGNVAPVIDSIILNSSSGTNLTSENLTAYVTSSDGDGDSVKEVLDWKLDGSSIAVLNMPFEATGGNESSWTKDYSTFGNDGVLYGTPTWDNDGGQDGFGVYDFDGDDYILPPDDSSLRPDDITICGWFYSLSDANMALHYYFDYGAYQGIELKVRNHIIAIFQNGTDRVSVTKANHGYNKWVHVCMRYADSNASLYVDGQYIDSETLQGGIEYDTTNNGVYIGGSYSYFNGSLDDFRVYNRTLSAEQINQIYLETKDTNPPNGSIVSQETSSGDDWSVCATPNDGFEDGNESCSSTLTVINEFIPPNQTENNGPLGTDFENYTSTTIQNVIGYVWHSLGNGIIQWAVPLNLSNASVGGDNNINDDVDFGSGFASIDSSVSTGAPAFADKAAEITFYDVDCGQCNNKGVIYSTGQYSIFSALQADGESCVFSGRCSSFSCTSSSGSGNCTFDITGFTGYGVGGNANLTINDSAEGTNVLVGNAVTFYAHYVNATTGAMITGAQCNVSYAGRIDTMIEGGSYYYFTNTSGFGSQGVKDWNVTCNKVGATKLFAEDTLDVRGLPSDVSAAVVPVQVEKIFSGRFNDTTPGNRSVFGGNETMWNLSVSSSSTKWQGYYGQVTASIGLGTLSGHKMYEFGDADNTQIKSVFTSIDPSFNFGEISAGSAIDVDIVYGWDTTDSESGTNTFNDGTKTISQLSDVPVVNLTAHTVGGSKDAGLYRSGVFRDDGLIALTGYSALAYGVSVEPDQKAFDNDTQVDYELVVPVNSSSELQTYYFFLELE